MAIARSVLLQDTKGAHNPSYAQCKYTQAKCHILTHTRIHTHTHTPLLLFSTTPVGHAASQLGRDRQQQDRPSCCQCTPGLLAMAPKGHIGTPAAACALTL